MGSGYKGGYLLRGGLVLLLVRTPTQQAQVTQGSMAVSLDRQDDGLCAATGEETTGVWGRGTPPCPIAPISQDGNCHGHSLSFHPPCSFKQPRVKLIGVQKGLADACMQDMQGGLLAQHMVDATKGSAPHQPIPVRILGERGT